MHYIIGFLLIWYGLFTLETDFTLIHAWVVLSFGIVLLARIMGSPIKAKKSKKGDGYTSSQADYTNGGGE